MDYLTAAEIADKWKVSSRMVAYYCKSGRIEGTVKKGKTWFVPADSPKPLDKRYSRDIIKVKDSQAGDTLAADVAESAVYHTKDIFKHLGLSRETLRYYEEIGLIKPKRGQYSRYREFDLFDMSCLMAIDFYKKRGFSPVAIKGGNAVNTGMHGAVAEKLRQCQPKHVVIDPVMYAKNGCPLMEPSAVDALIKTNPAAG